MRMVKLIVTLGVVGLTILSMNIMAEVYRWVDQEGVVHYGDQPYYSDVKKVKLNVSAPEDVHLTNRSKQRQQALKNYNEAQAEQALKEQENSSEAAKKIVRCNRANKLKKSYASAAHLYQKNKAGKKVMLSHEKKKAAMKEVNSYLDKWCK